MNQIGYLDESIDVSGTGTKNGCGYSKGNGSGYGNISGKGYAYEISILSNENNIWSGKGVGHGSGKIVKKLNKGTLNEK